VTTKKPRAPSKYGTLTLPVETIEKLHAIAEAMADPGRRPNMSKTAAALVERHVTTSTALAAIVMDAPVPRRRPVRKPSAEALAALPPGQRAAYIARMEAPQPTYAAIAKRPEIQALGLTTEQSAKYAAEQAIKKLHG